MYITDAMCLWGLEKLMGKTEGRGKDAQWHRATFTYTDIFKDRAQSGLWIPGPSPSQMNALTRPVVYNSNCEETWSDILEESISPPILLPPKKTKVIHKQPLGWIHFNHYNLFQTTIQFRFPMGKATKCTWGGSESDQLVIICLFWKSPSTCDIYMHTHREWAAARWPWLCVSVCTPTPMHSNSSSKRNKQDLNMSTKCLKWSLPERED